MKRCLALLLLGCWPLCAANVLLSWHANPQEERILSYWVQVTNAAVPVSIEFRVEESTNALILFGATNVSPLAPPGVPAASGPWSGPGDYGFRLAASNVLGRSGWTSNYWLHIPPLPDRPDGAELYLLPMQTRIGFTNLPSQFVIAVSEDLEAWFPYFYSRPDGIAWIIPSDIGHLFFRVDQ